MKGKSLLRSCKIAALLSLVFLAVALGVFVLATAKDAQQLLRDTDAVMIQAKHDERETNRHLNEVLINVNGTAQRLNAASSEEMQYWHKATKDADKTVAALRLFISLTNRRFNDGLVPQAQDTVQKMGVTADQMSAALQGIEPAIKHMDQTTAELQKLIADPNWKKTVDNVQDITKNTADVTKVIDTKVRSKKVWIMMGLKTAMDIASDVFTIIVGVR